MILYLIGLGVYMYFKKGEINEHTFLELNLRNGIYETEPDDPAARLIQGDMPVLRDIVESLQVAADDERVIGLTAKISGAKISFAHIQELRNAILDFRKKGKPAVVYTESFGEFGPGNGAYYLATAFDTIFLQPSGDIGLTGLMAESSFFKGALDKLGVVPRIDSRHEFKNMKNMFTEKEYTAPHEEALTAILNSLQGQLIKGVASGRGMDESSVRQLIDKGLFSADEALAANLVDGLKYRDQVYDYLEAKFQKDPEYLSYSTYLKRAGRPYEKGEKIALIYGVGAIKTGKTGYNPLTGEAFMGSDSITKAFRNAIEDDDVRAIVFRVNSPGGSYIASDAILRETIRAASRKKPVVVSMGNVAGSGGYFVAMAANRIFAQPATITGSIGVLGGKMITAGFWDKIGVSWDRVQTGENADMWSSISDYSPEQWDLFQSWLDRVYADFTSKVAQNRNIPLEKVQEIARGRIWSGETALELGLVDAMGGLSDAVRYAKQAAGLPDSKDIRLELFPKKKGWFEALLDRGIIKEDGHSMESAGRALRELQPVIKMLADLPPGGNSGVLEIDPANTRWLTHGFD